MPSSASLRSPALVLTATMAAQVLATMILLTLPVVAPKVAADLHVSAAYVGVYIAIAYAAAMSSSLLSGSAVRRYGAIRCSQASLALCALGLLLSALPHVAATLVGGLLIGAGYGPITPASSHLLARSTPAHRLSFVFSLKQTGVPLGGGLAGLVAPALVEAVGWQAAFAAIAVAGLLCALALQPLRASLDADRDINTPLRLGSGLAGPLKLVFRQRSLTTLAAVSFLFSICQMSLLTYLVTFLYNDLSMSLIAAGVALAVAQTGGVVGRVLWGYLSDRVLGSVRMLALLAVLLGACALTTPWLSATTPTWVLLGVLALFGSSAVGWNGVYLAEVSRQAPKGQTSIATAGTLSVTYFGVVIGPPLFGLLAESLGRFGPAYASLALPAGLALVLLLGSRKAFTKAP